MHLFRNWKKAGSLLAVLLVGWLAYSLNKSRHSSGLDIRPLRQVSYNGSNYLMLQLTNLSEKFTVFQLFIEIQESTTWEIVAQSRPNPVAGSLNPMAATNVLAIPPPMGKKWRISGFGF